MLHTARLVSLLRVCRVSVPPILSPGRPFSCCARGGVKPRPWLAGTVIPLYHKFLRRESRFSDCNFSSHPRSMVVVSGILAWERAMVVAVAIAPLGHYMARRPVPERRHTWRQKVTIHDATGGSQTFYVEFGEYEDGRLAEVFITSHRMGDSFTRGMVDSLAKSVSVALQSGTSPHEMAKTLGGQNFPPNGKVEAAGSSVTVCTSLADYIAQEIVACYGEDGCRRVDDPPPELPMQQEPSKGKTAGYISPEPPGASN